MHKVLLVHNDNTPLKKNLPNSSLILFSPSIDDLNNSDIDTYISNEIIPRLKEEEFDLLVIKDSLSENYIDFYGLVLAYHIRLSVKELPIKCLVPIVILSEVDSYTINKITPLGKILFTKNIFISKNSIKALEEFNNIELKNLSKEEYINDFLNKIDIDPPKDYLSHHSITNEWAMYQWSHLLGVNTKATQKNEDKINTMLYFKYLVNKYNLTSKDEMPDDIKTKTGKVLLIDDKCDEGWHDVIKGFMDKNYSDIEFDSLGSGFKDIKEIETIKEKVKSRVGKFKPDIILLDLRLMEEIDSSINTTDDENSLPHINKISGIQILQYLKDKNQFNQGIQIIVFSASTDSLILDEVYKQGVLGYVKKDSPMNKYITSKNSLKKLKQLISGKGGGLERNYLKRIWSIQQDILNLPFLINTKDSKIFELRTNIKSVFEILNSNMPNAFVYAMLAIFKCLELLVSIYIEEKKGMKKRFAYWKNTDSKIDHFEWNDYFPKPTTNKTNDSTANKIRILIYEKFNLRDKEMHDIIIDFANKRNDEIHQKSPKIHQGDLIEWFEILSIILENSKKVIK